MSKRSASTGTVYKRHAHDYYITPPDAILPLLPHLADVPYFIEPCCGNGALVSHLAGWGLQCLLASDLVPKTPDALILDAITHDFSMGSVPFITNPPWSRKWLHPLIENLSNQAPTWLLFDSDWAYTQQAKRFRDRLVFVQAAGRVKWIAESGGTGFDNAAWYLFDRPDPNRVTRFGMMP